MIVVTARPGEVGQKRTSTRLLGFQAKVFSCPVNLTGERINRISRRFFFANSQRDTRDNIHFWLIYPNSLKRWWTTNTRKFEFTFAAVGIFRSLFRYALIFPFVYILVYRNVFISYKHVDLKNIAQMKWENKIVTYSNEQRNILKSASLKWSNCKGILPSFDLITDKTVKRVALNSVSCELNIELRWISVFGTSIDRSSSKCTSIHPRLL